jgi:coenzyme F420 hydrogenase subunit beta
MDDPVTEGFNLAKVVDGGYCVGCGACAAFDPGITMNFNDMQWLQAELPKDREAAPAATAVCPFADGTPDEDSLAKELFREPEIIEDPRIGRHLATFGGWVEDEAIRAASSSGGIGTWLQLELLDKALVDAILNVSEIKSDAGKSPLFQFTVAKTRGEVLANAKTRYYPVEMSDVIRYVLDNPGRYALIGVPCFVKAIRLAARQQSTLHERLHFVLGIVCGHLKSAAFADAIAWQCGVNPDDVANIDFRAKIEGRPASAYGVTIESMGNNQKATVTRPMEGLLGANWGHGLFKLKACEFCDDVLAETADAVVGDAWLPDYDHDHRGANVVIARHPLLLELLEMGAKDARIRLNSLTADQVAASQAGGLRHRRDGLAYRLFLTDKDHLDPHMRKIHRLRFELGQKSHAAFLRAKQSGRLQDFIETITPLIKTYDNHMKPSLAVRVFNLCHRKIIQSIKYLMRSSSPNEKMKI